MTGGALVDRIAERFGNEAKTAAGSVDREALGRIVFDSPDARLELEALVHPAVRDVVMAEIERFRADPEAALAVLDAALLVEADPPYPLDALLVVTAPLDLRLARLRARGLPEAEARRRMAAQIDDVERLARADVVVENQGSLRDLEREVMAVLSDLGLRPKRGE